MDRLASHDARPKLPHHRDFCHPRFPCSHSVSGDVRSAKERRTDPEFAVNSHAPSWWGFHSTFIWDRRRGDWLVQEKQTRGFIVTNFLSTINDTENEVKYMAVYNNVLSHEQFRTWL